MIPRPQLVAIVLLAIVVFTGAIWISGDAVSLNWVKYLGITIFVVATAIALFNRYLWRLSHLQGWFVKRPHIWGTWKATLNTDWINPESGSRQAPVDAKLTIRQTHGAVHVRMSSDKSKGDLLIARIIADDDGQYRLAGIYKNEPRLNERPSSGIHYGAFLLTIDGSPNSPTRMHGHYWTDRGTKGEMALEKLAQV